ncbi:unnamed protein product [Chironomus riparius]|uniref:Uncharacterized protein n=1 Tax=Chironomus riparius TaxID=315576 RepID=A0A9N9RLB1_9DIPT|nr:unnamed protein product [Chironomus riparius]
MEFSRRQIIAIALYTTFQSVIFIILSSLSILSYFCLIETPFTLSPTFYMIHLMYFKSQHCGNKSDWTHLNVMNYNEVQADRPDTSSAIERTFIISILYLILYSCLILSSALIILTLNHLAKRHLLACIMITFPFVLTMLLIFILDNFSAAYYSVDYARSSSTYGAMTVMEIRNREDIRPILEKVNPNILTFPAALMMYTSLKYYLFFVLNILSMIVIVPSVWNNLSQTKEAKVNDEKLYILRSSQCINVDRELPIN